MATTTAANTSAPVNTRSGKYRNSKSNRQNLVRDNFMSREDAQSVWRDTMRAWGIGGSNETTRDTLLASVAELLVYGTSDERKYAGNTIGVNGAVYDLGTLRTIAGNYTTGENPVRIWARSYENFDIVERMYGLLSNPENAALRAEQVLSYRTTYDYAHLCFDLSRHVVSIPDTALSQAERYFIDNATAYKVGPSRSMFIGASDGGSAGQMNGNAVAAAQGKVSPMVGTGPIASSGFDKRAGFGLAR